MKFFAVLLAAFIGFSAAQATDFENVDVIILGEVHDNPDAHIRQAEFLREIVPTAVVFEMLSPAAAAAANQVDRTDLFAIAEATAWSESGWPDFELYAPVFEALGDAHIVGARCRVTWPVKRSLQTPMRFLVRMERVSALIDPCTPIRERSASNFSSKPIARRCPLA